MPIGEGVGKKGKTVVGKRKQGGCYYSLIAYNLPSEKIPYSKGINIMEHTRYYF